MAGLDGISAKLSFRAAPKQPLHIKAARTHTEPPGHKLKMRSHWRKVYDILLGKYPGGIVSRPDAVERKLAVDNILHKIANLGKKQGGIPDERSLDKLLQEYGGGKLSIVNITPDGRFVIQDLTLATSVYGQELAHFTFTPFTMVQGVAHSTPITT